MLIIGVCAGQISTDSWQYAAGGIPYEVYHSYQHCGIHYVPALSWAGDAVRGMSTVGSARVHMLSQITQQRVTAVTSFTL